MGDLLFKCSICSKSLAVDVSLLGRRFICPHCQTRIHAPKPQLVFCCTECGCDLCSADKLAMQDFQCPNCDKKIRIPEHCAVSCPSCSLNIELDPDYYAELTGTNIDCPERDVQIAIAWLPGPEPSSDSGGLEVEVLPEGFGHKTMKLDELLATVPQAQRLNLGVCPYCSSKVHVLRGGSYVCKSCGRIMRMVNKPPA